MKLMHKLVIGMASVIVIIAVSLSLAPAILEGQLNIVLPHEPYEISKEAKSFTTL